MDIAVLGADSVGRVVARLCSLSGDEVRLHSHDATIVMDSIDVVERELDDAQAAGELDESARDDAIDRLEATTGLEAAVSDADVVIETTTADTTALQERFAEVEPLVGRETLITTASPLSSITAAAAGLRHPDRALGLHFPQRSDGALVEVVVAEQTTMDAVQRAERFVDGLPGEWIRVRDGPGNASMRLALALEVEAMRMVETHVADVEAIDVALKQGYGSEVGPLERADRAGLAERLETLEYLADEVGPRFSPPEILVSLVSAGNTGVDAGEGFYVWEGGEPTESAFQDPTVPRREEGLDDPAGERQ
ncbi:3-hydroxyacyl-CoA dehydrogenase [Halobacteriales archaeon QH_2_65_14]|nr:MAG: 3-hydroxyacyl-CoA dehydrogenase [Halobacteriales archaeon QH_2_65_14]